MEIATPQTHLSSSQQQFNNAGGASFLVSPKQQLQRFLILGSDSGTYYVQEKKLTLENAQNVVELLSHGHGVEVIQVIKDVSVGGRAPRQQPTMLALAICARYHDEQVRKAAYDALKEICRIPTHLFMFIECIKHLGETSGWGRLQRRAIADWYNSKDAKKLAFTMTKYQNREGWSHKDLLRLSHAKPCDIGHQFLFKAVTKGVEKALSDEALMNQLQEDEQGKRAVELFQALKDIKDVDAEHDVIELIRRHHLAREHIPTQWLNSKVIWTHLLQSMPMTAMIRNLGKMTNIGVLDEADNLQLVVGSLRDASKLKAARVHPFSILQAVTTYRNGKGARGKLAWNPNSEVVNALEDAFEASFASVEPTNNRFMLALDVSGSMGQPILGSPDILCSTASAAMAMVTLRTEPKCYMKAFSDIFIDLDINSSMNLETVMRKTSDINFGRTDCALPMIWAKDHKVPVDVFVVYTDSETWFGSIHPHEALRQYRSAMRIDAKLIVIGMTATQFTIADPSDPGMLDICGFDSSAPTIMREFVLGNI